MKEFTLDDEGWQELSGDGGVIKKILKEGEGNATPPPKSHCTIRYTLTVMKTDKVIDTRKFQFQLNMGAITAWDLCVSSMKKGEHVHLQTKHQYAYGERGSGADIPERATLFYDLTLLYWEEDLTDKSEEEKYEAYVKKKEEGNKWFKLGRYHKCKKRYERVLWYLRKFPILEMENDELKKKCRKLQVSVWGNICAVYFKEKKTKECIDECDKILAFFKRISDVEKEKKRKEYLSRKRALKRKKEEEEMKHYQQLDPEEPPKEPKEEEETPKEEEEEEGKKITKSIDLDMNLFSRKEEAQMKLKVFYRRSICHRMRLDWDLCEKDLKKALKIDEGSKLFQNQLQILEKMKKKQHEKEKKKFSGMFDEKKWTRLVEEEEEQAKKEEIERKRLYEQQQRKYQQKKQKEQQQQQKEEEEEEDSDDDSDMMTSSDEEEEEEEERRKKKKRGYEITDVVAEGDKNQKKKEEEEEDDDDGKGID